MRLLLAAVLLALLSGCAAAPRNIPTAALPEAKAEAQRTDAIAERAGQYMKRGYSQRDAYARAESDTDGTLTPLRKLEPHARGI